MVAATMSLNQQVEKFLQVLFGQPAKKAEQDGEHKGLVPLLRGAKRMNARLKVISHNWDRLDNNFKKSLVRVAEDSSEQSDTDWLLNLSGEPPRIVLQAISKVAILMIGGDPETAFLPKKSSRTSVIEYVELVVLLSATANFVNTILDTAAVHNGPNIELGSELREALYDSPEVIDKPSISAP